METSLLAATSKTKRQITQVHQSKVVAEAVVR